MAIEAVLDEALRLPEAERAELVSHLLDSLEGSDVVEPGHDAAWTEVIDRRVEEIRDGRATLSDGNEVLARARAIVAAHRRR
ncbi:MAG TPA: addiction module protein [Kofleriaceae bacterium]|jgi:putative addiction module component (TIGR02574 family)|nr:addiction module protein [Kofleriaceae bacterium]